MPIYEAISFQHILEKDGHSKPWVVMVNVEGSPKPYVVKLYKTADIEARNKMTAKVLGNVLANKFALKTPEAAIINFSDDFRMSLKQNSEDILSEVDERPKFGSYLLEGANTYNIDTKRSEVRNIVDLAILYAYDYFICNRDRTINNRSLFFSVGANGF